jgi:hypothetical protein
MLYAILCRSHRFVRGGYNEEARQERIRSHRELGGGSGEVCYPQESGRGEDFLSRGRDGAAAEGVRRGVGGRKI